MISNVLCCCSRHIVAEQDVTIVSNGIPACSRECYERNEKRVAERRAVVEKFVTGGFRGKWEDTIPEPYSRNDRYGDT